MIIADSVYSALVDALLSSSVTHPQQKKQSCSLQLCTVDIFVFCFKSARANSFVQLLREKTKNILRVLSFSEQNALLKLDKLSSLGILLLLGLTVSCDSANRIILIRQLKHKCLSGSALDCFSSHLSNTSLQSSTGNSCSSSPPCRLP